MKSHIKSKNMNNWKSLKISFILLLASVAAFAQNDAIQVGKDGKEWNILTPSSVYRINVSANGIVNAVCYGSRTMLENVITATAPEIPVRGGFVATLPLLEAVFPDGVRDIELAFKSYELITVDGRATLKIVQQDKFYPLEVSSFIRALPEYDLIEKWVEIRHTGKKGSIKIENLQSGSVFLPVDSYELTHYSGVWGHEFRPNKTKLTQGTKTIQVRDFKSYGSSSFMVRPEGETGGNSGKVWFGSLCYSGNWRVDFEKMFVRPSIPGRANLQITGGINFWDQELYLKPGQSSVTPRMVFGYTEEGTDGVTLRLTSYTREQLLPGSRRDKIRPVLYNSWYTTFYAVNEQQQLALAKIAKEIGVEMFVIDDGWFKGRINHLTGLGDWTVDKNKFPNGLKPLVDSINALGMDFGIWVEPEMVTTNSDIYKLHPDWIFRYPNRQQYEGRNQLNLAREDVFQYIYQSLYKLISENNIKFIKWDHNRPLVNPGYMSASSDEQRAVRIRYMENLYRLVNTLRADFPDVWFENCSSGGGRIDLGMARSFDFNWVSDNSDPTERIFLHDSYLTLFPANTMISWVTKEDWHQQDPSLAYKFDVSMAGVLGVGNDLIKWTDEDRKLAKDKIALYKEIRETTQKGDVFRIISPFEANRSIIQYVSKNKKKSVVFNYRLAEYPENSIPENQQSPLVKLRGLEPETKYKFDKINGAYSGKYLMEVGIRFPLKGAFKSDIYKIESTD